MRDALGSLRRASRNGGRGMMYFGLCLVVFLVTYLINITYISVFYHRGLAHGAVRLSPAVVRLVAYTGNWFTGLDPKGWVCMHRLHHDHSDTAEDPHSPVHFGIFGVLTAQLDSYKRTLRRLNRGDETYRSKVADIPFGVNWLNKRNLWYLPYVVHGVVAMALGEAGGWLLGAAYFAGMMSHPIQGWMVNSLGHAKGYRNFAIDDQSRNNTLVAWLVMGEGYQNNHHRYPASAKFSCRWFEFDAGYLWCQILERAGLIEIEQRTLAARDGDLIGVEPVEAL